MSKRKPAAKIDDRTKIDLFIATVNELTERRFFPDGLNAFNFTIRVDSETQEILTTIQEGDQEDFRAFLTTFRKFLLEGEPSHIYSILKICRRYVKPEETDFVEFLDASKKIWQEIYEHGMIKMKRGKLELSPKYVINLWLSTIFHGDDLEKRKQLQELLEDRVPAVKIQLLWSLPTITNFILRFNDALRISLERNLYNFPASG
jgi:hypothetical protein